MKRVFTISRSDEGCTDLEFEEYLGLLRERGLDVPIESARTLEPGTENRWPHVWLKASDALHFLIELRARTTDRNWCLYSFAVPTSFVSETS
jgi:hypothetical protein